MDNQHNDDTFDRFENENSDQNRNQDPDTNESFEDSDKTNPTDETPAENDSINDTPSDEKSAQTAKPPVTPEPIAAAQQPQPIPPQPRKSSGWKIFFGILFAFSVIFNFILLFAIMAVAAFGITKRSENGFQEAAIQKGYKSNKVAIIRLEGVINMEMAEKFKEQIEKAKKDKTVKGLIIKTISPGGSVVASDEIHHEIMKYREKTEKPVVAFMQGLAASGGYYTSVACDKIIAEPTTITGSIGVIMQTFSLQELVEEKLGVQPVTVKSGEKKDWPTSFKPVTEEQIEYLQQKLIQPAYNRFVNLIDKGRTDLTIEQIKELADGSIYHATEAMENGLIDEIGYIEDAIETISELAGIEKPYVFEYQERFKFADILGAEERANSILNINKNTVREMMTPELLYLWDGTN